MCVHAQNNATWLWVYGLLVVAVVIISITRALAFFECTFRHSLSPRDPSAAFALPDIL